MADFVVADTDILIDYLQDAGPGADLVDGMIRAVSLAVTTPTLYELHVGVGPDAALDHRLQTILEAWLLPLDPVGAADAAAIDRGLAATGTSIGTMDCLIAGICRSYGLPLATRNRKHFERIEGLELVDI